MASDPSAAPQDSRHLALGKLTHRRLRETVLELKVNAPRGRLPACLWAGTPGSLEQGRAVTFEPGPHEHFDHDTRVEVCVAMGNRALLLTRDPMLWLTRSGDQEPSPSDLEWLAAASAAWSELDLAPSFAVLTRHGWRHHPSGEERTWRRLRARPRTTSPAGDALASAP